MSRVIAAFALASALVTLSAAPRAASAAPSAATVATAAPAAVASPDAAPAPLSTGLPTPSSAPSAAPDPTTKGKSRPRPVPAAAPGETATAPASSPAPGVLLAPTRAPSLRYGAAPFVYLRDRYRRDDQGAALRTPIARLAQLEYLLGTWSAHIYTLTGAHRVTHDFGHTTYVFARTMNDRWILGTDAKNTEYLYFTYDPPAQHWVYNDVKGFPSYGLSYATGSPHHLRFEAVVESALGDERRLRTKLDYVDAKHFSLRDEELTPDDAWTPVVEFDFARR